MLSWLFPRPRRADRLPLRLLALEARDVPAGIPVLHSLPTAPVTVYLDFDGYVGNGLNHTPYDVDGNATDFNTAEVATITEAWRQISNYFSPFDVDVTTEAGSTKPTNWSLISNSVSGGYSYLQFPSTYPRAFNQASDGRTRQSGIAHEIGHNFGLYHQADYDLLGNLVNEYSSGFDNTHGPIMGVDYAKAVHKWTIGHTSNSPSTVQNDVVNIANKVKAYQPAGGDGFRADDYTATTTLSPTNGVYSVSGTIERYADADAFQFQAFGGPTTLTFTPPAPSGLDARIDIVNADGVVVATGDSTSTTTNGQTLVLTLAAGTYTAVVRSHGDAGDLGMYDLTIRSLPTNFVTADVGSVGIAGTAGGTAADAVTLLASGAGTATSDEFRFAYARVNGNGGIAARVTGLTTTAAGRFAGVTLREGTGNTLKFVQLQVTGNNGVQLVSRNGTGGSATTITLNAGAAFTPTYLRLTRATNTLTGEASADGVTWTTVGSVSVNLGTTPLMGVVASSANDAATAVATFTEITTTGTVLPGVAPATLAAVAAPATPAVTLATGTGYTVTWENVAGEGGYVVETSPDGATWSTAATLSADVTSFNTGDVAGSQRWFFRVAATVSSVKGPYSEVVSAVNRPSAPTAANFSITSWTQTALILNWRDVPGDTGYRVERSTDGTTFTTLAAVGTNVNSYTNTGLIVGTRYYYRVVPLSPQGDGPAATAESRYTRLNAVTGLTMTDRQTTAVGLSWTAVSGATGYRIDRSTDRTSWTSAGTTTTATTFTNSGLTAASEYYFRVAATVGDSESVTYPVVFGATLPTAALPAPWQTADVGAVGGPGVATLSGTTFTLLGAGASIGSTADEFRFVHQTLNGDDVIAARVATQENTSDTAKAGIMLRAGTAANAANVSLLVTPTNGLQLQSRTTAGGGTAVNATVSGIVAPVWVRLTRTGTVIAADRSTDGTTWTAVGSVTVNLGTSIVFGLAVSSADDTLLNKSTFTNVTVSDTVAPQLLTLTPATAGPTNAATVAYTATFSEAVTGVAAGNFTVVGGPGTSVASVTGSGTTWTITVNTGTSDGPLHLDLTSVGSIADAAGNSLGGTLPIVGGVVDVDRVAPTASSIVPTPAGPTNAATVNYAVTFSEAVTGVTASNFTLTATGLTGASIGTVSGGGTSWTVPVTTGSGQGTLALRLATATGIVDAVGNALGGTLPVNAATVTVDRVGPSLATVAVPTGATSAGTVTYTAIFSEAVTGVTADNFTLVANGVTGASVVGVNGTGASRTVTVNTGTGSGTLRLDFATGTGITDFVGNAFGGPAPLTGATATLDRVRPQVVGVVVTSTNETYVTYTVTFSEAMVNVTAANFTAVGTNLGKPARVELVTGSGTTWTVLVFAVSPPTEFGRVRLDVTAAAGATDAAGNLLDLPAAVVGPTVRRFAISTR